MPATARSTAGATSAPEAPASTPLALRSAIVHDWFQGFHGSERVVDTIRTGVFSSTTPPDVYTFHAERELLPAELSKSIVRESRLAGMPGIRQRGHDPGRWRYLLPYMPRYFRNLDLSGYELVVSSSHACAANVRVGEDALHVCYCHTPMRYAWLPSTERGRASGMRGLALRGLATYLRRVDRAASRRPDSYVANSRAVSQRIAEFYGRDSVVIHPPVDVDEFDPTLEKEPGHFLWVHRLVSYKRPELVVEAFRGLPYRLTMVGVGPLERTLRQGLPSNVELRGWLSRHELVRLYELASGFIHVAEEDFGISMVEALAAGTPVVALQEGGATDIVRNGTDGVLIPRPDLGELRCAIRHVAEADWSASHLADRARAFSRDAFVRAFSDHIRALRV